MTEEIHRVFGFKADNDTRVSNEIIDDFDIDFYTLGLYVRYKSYVERNLDLDSLEKRGKEEFIKKAVEKLENKKYIKGE